MESVSVPLSHDIESDKLEMILNFLKKKHKLLSKSYNFHEIKTEIEIKHILNVT